MKKYQLDYLDVWNVPHTLMFEVVGTIEDAVKTAQTIITDFLTMRVSSIESEKGERAPQELCY